jgi:hypothetical protein
MDGDTALLSIKGPITRVPCKRVLQTIAQITAGRLSPSSWNHNFIVSFTGNCRVPVALYVLANERAHEAFGNQDIRMRKFIFLVTILLSFPQHESS